MFEGVLVVLAIMAVLGVGVPLALLYLLARQVFPSRPLATGILVVVGLFTLPFGLVAWAAAGWLQWEGRRTRTAPAARATHHSPLGREWSRLAAEAAGAAARFDLAIASLPAGPLRDRLGELRGEVAAGVTEARRLAVDGDRLSRAHRDVERALLARRRSVARDSRSAAAVHQSLTAQAQSAARLATAESVQRERLQVLVCRLDELVAHATELTALPTTAETTAAALADQVAALRLATLEVAALSPH